MNTWMIWGVFTHYFRKHPNHHQIFFSQKTLLPIEALSPTAASPTFGGPALGIVPSPGAIVTVQQSWHAVQVGRIEASRGWFASWKNCVFFCGKINLYTRSLAFLFWRFWLFFLEMDDLLESFCYVTCCWNDIFLKCCYTCMKRTSTWNMLKSF